MISNSKLFLLAVGLALSVAALHPVPVHALGSPSCTCNYLGPDGDWKVSPVPAQSASLGNCQNTCLAGWRVGSVQDTCHDSPIGEVCGGSSSISSLAQDSCNENAYVYCTPG